MQDSTAKLIAELAHKIVYHRRLYTAGQPEISDAEFDRLEDALRAMAPHHPVLQQVGGKLAIPAEKKVAHNQPMLSLAKTYELTELLRWAENRELVGTFKIDGNSLSLIYKDGRLEMAKTRGNGKIGEEVTDKVRWVGDCPYQIAEKLAEHRQWEIRGELYCSQERFSELLVEMHHLGLEPATSPRNIVAGILGRKQHIALARFFSFFAFDVLVPGELPFAQEWEKLQWLERAGFHLPTYRLLRKANELQDFLALTQEHMMLEDIGIDGAVFTYNDLGLHAQLGHTSHHPRYKLSFKWQGLTAVSRILALNWATSRLGVVTPVAIIEPVQLSGAKITNVSLHNAAYVESFNLKEGDRIEIVRSGEVIPKFIRVVEPAIGTYELPKFCPACASPLSFDEVRLLCPNSQTCPAQIAGSILNWIRCVGIDDLSAKRLQQLLDRGMVRHVADLYKLNLDDFLSLPLTKEKMAQKLYKHIQASKDLSLAQFLNGLGIKGLGLASWELLLAHFPSFEALQKADVQAITRIHGFAQKTAEQIVAGLSTKRDDIALLLAAGVKPRLPAPAALTAVGPLQGKQLVITGSLSKPRSEIVACLQAAGAKVMEQVSKHTDVLIIADPQSNSSKAKKARELGVSLWSEEELWQILAK